jgi:transcriptional regulator with XRE-family HTH domain
MTLRELRTSSGLSLEEVAAHVATATGRSYQPGTVLLWEHRGIKNGAVLAALATLYGKSVEDVIAAEANGKGPLLRRGRKPRNLLQNVVN